ncbi:MAG: sulfurtransferase TusA family protein [Deltaproteobacteria bacterium]|nr:sulfurtransferase TusA family protein [Deltaproteobacteria bacterium]
MRTVDLRGVCCPTNFVRAKLALEDCEAGEEVQILLDDGEAVKNVPRSLKGEGHRLLALKEQPEGYYVLDLKKGED